MILLCFWSSVLHLDLVYLLATSLCAVSSVPLCAIHVKHASIFSVLMGDNVDPRKEFINEHANNLKLDDLDF